LRFRPRAIWKTSLIGLQISSVDAKNASFFVYQALTVMGKDCGNIGQKSISAYTARPKPMPIRTRCNVARVRSRNGEQAWP
jgi:hypothetical protein